MVNPKTTNPDKPDPKPNTNGYGKSSVEVTNEANRPDWLPAGWKYREFLRTSSASAGTKDKYFIDPVTGRRFRSKLEVMRYLETGTTPNKKRKPTDSDNVSAPNLVKRKKSEAKPKASTVSIENFNFDDVPEKVKWVLTDVYEATWRPEINGVDEVSESTKQEWGAAFKYLTLQKGGRA